MARALLLLTLLSGCDVPVRAGEVDCGDGVDDDGDGRRDCADVDCMGSPVCSYDAGPRDVGFEACTGVLAEADERIAPLDVVFVVDSSESMLDEAARVQDQINGFAAAIIAAGIDDLHVVMITQRDWVRVPPPLGTDTSRLLVLNRFVDSHAGFSVLLAAFADYEPFLRSDAALHFVIVTDDETNVPADVFLPQMSAAVGRPFVVHAIASPEGGPVSSTGGCVGPGGSADAHGIEYLAAVTATGGVFQSICSGDWAPLFARLTTAVAIVRPIPCVFVIPPPPDGTTFDRARVNVRHSPPAGAPTVVPRSDTCAADVGWHYDDAADPTEVRLCPATCDEITRSLGRIDVEFGCETLLF